MCKQICWYLFSAALGVTLTAISGYSLLNWQWWVADILLFALAAASR